MENDTVARCLEETAELLQAQGANPFRVQAYRKAAATVRGLRQPVADIYRNGGDEGLRGLPGIGDRLGAGLRSLILTGRLPHAGEAPRRNGSRGATRIGSRHRAETRRTPASRSWDRH